MPLSVAASGMQIKCVKAYLPKTFKILRAEMSDRTSKLTS